MQFSRRNFGKILNKTTVFLCKKNNMIFVSREKIQLEANPPHTHTHIHTHKLEVKWLAPFSSIPLHKWFSATIERKTTSVVLPS